MAAKVHIYKHTTCKAHTKMRIAIVLRGGGQSSEIYGVPRNTREKHNHRHKTTLEYICTCARAHTNRERALVYFSLVVHGGIRDDLGVAREVNECRHVVGATQLCVKC